MQFISLRLKAQLTFNKHMSATDSTAESKLCPQCKKGYLRPVGKSTTIGKTDEPFTPTVHMQDLKCDNDGCSHVEKAASLTK